MIAATAGVRAPTVATVIGRRAGRATTLTLGEVSDERHHI